MKFGNNQRILLLNINKNKRNNINNINNKNDLNKKHLLTQKVVNNKSLNNNNNSVIINKIINNNNKNNTNETERILNKNYSMMNIHKLNLSKNKFYKSPSKFIVLIFQY